jgi:hypothetical protein
MVGTYIIFLEYIKDKLDHKFCALKFDQVQNIQQQRATLLLDQLNYERLYYTVKAILKFGHQLT